MIYRTYYFQCSNCGCETTFAGGISHARGYGWAVARDRYTCYCSACAPMFRSVGCKGQPRKVYQLK